MLSLRVIRRVKYVTDVRRALSPIRVSALSRMAHAPIIEWVMDSMAAAAEAGRLHGSNYLEQIFASREDVRAFRVRLREEGPDLWLNDRHHNAMRKLASTQADSSTYQRITAFLTHRKWSMSGVNYNRRRRQLKLPPYAATGADAVGLAPAAFAR